MTRTLKIVFSLMLIVYMAIALTVTARRDDTDLCRGLSIEVDGQPRTGGIGGVKPFVTAEELEHELGDLPARARGIALANINTQEIRHRLLQLDKIEDATVVRYTDGSIRIRVRPIEPVLRVFDRSESYYVNRTGKRVKASARYHKNVPIIQGHFDTADSAFTPLSLLPLLNYIASDTIWNVYIGMIKVNSPTDILLIPNIRQHVINIGAPTDLPDKFDRLLTFYRKVLPRQGWEKYDTLSLKWDGQLVATKRHRRAPDIPVITHDDDEAVSIDAMLAGDGVAPGRTLPGQEAHSERPIPAKKS